MPVKIRLMRIGAKKRPFYRIVAVDERKKRTGGYLELLGTYNPLTTPHDIKLKQDRIDHWLKNGAQPSDGFLRITGKAPQRPARKPKKEKPAVAETPAPAKEEETKPEAEDETPEVVDEVTTPEAAEPVQIENIEDAVESEEKPTEDTPAEDQVIEEVAESTEAEAEDK